MYIYGTTAHYSRCKYENSDLNKVIKGQCQHLMEDKHNYLLYMLGVKKEIEEGD